MLYSRLISEQVTPLPSQPSYKVGPQGGTLPASDKGYAVKKNPTDNSITVTKMEGEIEEGKKKDKKSKTNPWAICTSQLGGEFGTKERHLWNAKQKNKYERCVKDVKNQLKEGKNPVSLFLENKIMKLVEKHIPPRITKNDLLNYLTETETAPAKPKTDPKTKPGEKPTTRPRPGHPGKNPNPGENPAPKAISPEKAKDEVINTIMKLLKK
jgi:hypothetical protein